MYVLKNCHFLTRPIKKVCQPCPTQFAEEVKHCKEALGQLRGRATAQLKGNNGPG